ncbi:glycoside hydrolase family 16 protein [Saccharospirillum alexandrii]|uniref:glycoside hydrolase family 16 protein n=1 Tax=Saccharospirillum alexandrii TaxID=2448477 RepID=UPI000FD8ACAA|nr:glycoside hydrolase family 16 protein [Saccharospirillum alexandrii]
MNRIDYFENNQRSHSKWVIPATILTAFLLSACLETNPETSPESNDDAETDPEDLTPEPQPESEHSMHHPVDKNWRLVWSDEFENAAIDPAKWSYEQNCWGGGNNEQQCYTDQASNAFIEDGALVIKAIKEDFTGPIANQEDPGFDPNNTQTLPYTSARLRTLNKGDWRYGRFEIRAQLPAGQGTWPAIWMLPTDWVYGGWAASGEIDIMEAVNLETQSDADGATPGTPEHRVHGTLHYGQEWPDNVHSGTYYDFGTEESPADGFHHYAIEWQSGEIRWYVDGQHYATQTDAGWYSQYPDPDTEELVIGSGSAPFNKPFHLILNLAVGGNWATNVNERGIDADVFPQTMKVDYVRVYQCDVDAVTGAGCATRNPDAETVAGYHP